MSQQNPEDNISDLAQAASKSIIQQREKSEALAAKRPKPPLGKQIFAAILLLAFAGAAMLQYPKFNEPFGRPDPNQDQTVAEADLTVIAMMIQSYKLAQDRLPVTLDEVRLPDALARFVAEQKIGYRLTEKAYALDWELPRWHAVFDGETGKVDFVQVSGTK